MTRENKGLIDYTMFKEWEKINTDIQRMVDWQYHCRKTEPNLFLGCWEEWIRTSLNPLIREIAPAVALNGGCIRTIESLFERALLMGYFFGTRRYEGSIEDMDPMLAQPEEDDDEENLPDTGGFSSRDFLL
ncbi:MAG: hypothetical protein DRQ98_13110 [Gammaproteobacteria bacterium]|nr:MAG: hypothetical protein DRQ98_13110 [Gammaproteobacteria bacterium]